MRLFRLLVTFALCLRAGSDTAAHRLWDELAAQLAKLSSVHEEFEVTQTYKTTHGDQSSKRQIILDMSGREWREKSVSGSGSFIRIFDDQDLLRMEEGGDEYIRMKRKPKEDAPMPGPYQMGDVDWSRATEVKRAPCGMKKVEHTCVYLHAPIRPSQHTSPNQVTRVLEGSRVLCVDTETGILLSSQSAQVMQNARESYRSEVTFAVKAISYGGPADAALFHLPPGDIREVKALSVWNVAKMKKQLVGTAAPELTVTDVKGNTITLSALRGKIVLLDFWTTWCLPCRADAPALDKLYKKYGPKDLMIVGFSVSEDRGVVEKFLREHPHSFPVALTTENEMPRPFQIGVLPTYVIVDRDGNVAGAAQGDQGFGELRKLLKKAGLEID